MLNKFNKLDYKQNNFLHSQEPLLGDLMPILHKVTDASDILQYL
jgi:hypothetical protein